MLCPKNTKVKKTIRFEFTDKQGQYLAFIYNYTKMNRRPPAEADIQMYFRVTPPTVHQMILKLEEKELISRTPGQPRSLRVLVPPHQLPYLK
jgi:Mn-dependent DtxR family transcriptional regulator